MGEALLGEEIGQLLQGEGLTLITAPTLAKTDRQAIAGIVVQVPALGEPTAESRELGEVGSLGAEAEVFAF